MIVRTFHLTFFVSFVLAVSHEIFSLTLVTMNQKRIEVYFLSGRDTGEILSYLPGMEKYNRVAKLKKFLADLWNGACGGGLA